MYLDNRPPPFLSVGGIGGIRTEETSKKKLVIESALLKKRPGELGAHNSFVTRRGRPVRSRGNKKIVL